MILGFVATAVFAVVSLADNPSPGGEIPFHKFKSNAPLDGEVFLLVNTNSGRCLTEQDGAIVQGVFASAATSQERWQLVRVGDVLAEARETLRPAGADVQQALDNLEQIARLAQRKMPEIALHFDLAELRGYQYYTGVVFSAFIPGQGHAVAQGGRYDGIGRAFGRARAATGFSADLRLLLKLAPGGAGAAPGILAPYVQAPSLQERIRALRATGERVVVRLPGAGGSAAENGCDRELVERDGAWTVVKI